MFTLIFGTLCILFSAIWWFSHLHRRKSSPPGPHGLPIIGHLHMLGSLPHRTLSQFSKTYGPIMSLRLGKVPTVVVSSAKAAEIFLKTHDNIFGSRPPVQASRIYTYGNKGIVFQTGAYWRSIRKICVVELLSNKKIEGLSGMRKEELGFLVDEVKAAAVAGEVVDLSEKVAQLVEDMTCKMLFGRCKYDKMNLKNIINEVVILLGAFNVSDYLPWLENLDIQGFARRMKKESETLDKMLETIIEEHEENPSEESPHQDIDFMDVMLSLMKRKSTGKNDENSLSIDRTSMKAIILDMIAGAIDTSSISIQWVLSELIRNPRTMKKLQEELNNVVGPNKMVEESDLPNLHYLAMVVKEGMRLHPAAPLSLPHESLEDVVINGYFIPKRSRVLINIWAIGRDPDTWSDNSEEFLPERFIGRDIDVKGRNFELIPFGSGRRGCPGITLGLVNIQLMVAQLVHCFDWKLPDGMSPTELDMTEVFGLGVPRAKHLLLVPTYRL